MEEKLEFQKKRLKYILAGGMKIIKGGEPTDGMEEEESEKERTNVEFNKEEGMEKISMVIEPVTSLYDFIEDHMKDNASKMKNAKLEILDAFLELQDLDDEDTAMTRKVLYDYKFLLDYIEEAAAKSEQI